MKYYRVYDAYDGQTDFIGNADQICERYKTDYISIQRAFKEEIRLRGLYFIADATKEAYEDYRRKNPERFLKREICTHKPIRCSSGVRFK